MDAEKEKCPKSRNENAKRGGKFSAPSKQTFRPMFSLPEGMVAGNVKTRQEEVAVELLKNQMEELAEEAKTLKFGQEELAKVSPHFSQWNRT